MKKLEQQLTVLGLSTQEARVYISLLRGGQMTGYQIARDLGTSRSGVYNTLQSLYHRGAVYLIPGDTREYRPLPPEEFIGELQRRFSEAAEEAKSGLAALEGTADDEQFLNIRGRDRVLTKARELIGSARREILMNTDIPVADLEPELGAALDRGVAVTLFSYFPQKISDGRIRFHKAGSNGGAVKHHSGNSRLMLCADMAMSILGGSSQGDFTATVSANPLLTAVIAEHIHIDSYLLGIRRELHIHTIPAHIKLQSILEENTDL
jgi:sugar-specific transcriptional regulator TrmB